MTKFTVGVDTGAIEIARNPDHLERGGQLYAKVQELACETAAAAWDGKKGAIGTPHGDGVYTVLYDQAKKYDWHDWWGKALVFLVNLPGPQKAKPFTLYMGDVGRMDGMIEFPEHTLIMCAWTSEDTLLFISE